LAEGDRQRAVAPPDHALFEAGHELRDLRQRHGALGAGKHVEVAQPREVAALAGFCAGDDVDQLVVFAKLRDRQPGHQRVHVLRERPRRGADRACLVGVDVELQGGQHLIRLWLL
jgi:hypothetical protein